jgi:hypothetical protein
MGALEQMTSNVNDNFEQVQSGIRVREAGSNRINRVDTPSGFSDLMFRNVVAAFDTAYRTLGMLPTVTDVHKYYPSAPVKTISALFLTEEFKDAIRYRGIDWSPDSGLSMEQNMALLALSDPTDRRSTSVKMRDLGIPYSRLSAWMRHPLFAQTRMQMSENNLKDAVPMVIDKVIGNAEAGDQRALELILKMTGRWNPDQMQLDDAKTVVLKVVESVIRNVSDAKIRAAILADVQAEVVSFNALHQQAVEE